MVQPPRTRKATRGPSPQKTRQTRERIFETGLEQFTRHGFAATKMDEIAEACGCGKGTLYRYFPTKDALLLQIVSERVVGTFKDVRGTARLRGEPMEAYCQRTLLPIIETSESSGRADLARLVLHEAQSFPELHSLYHSEVYLPLKAHLRWIVETAQSEGEIDRAHDPDRLAHLLLSPLWFAIIHNGLLARGETVDGAALFAAQIACVFGGQR